MGATNKRGSASVPAQATRTITMRVAAPGSREDCVACCQCADEVMDAALIGDLDGAADALKDLHAHIEQEHG